MEKIQIPEKASSFSGRNEKKVCEPSRNLSLTHPKPEKRHAGGGKKDNNPPRIEEETDSAEKDTENAPDGDQGLAAASAEIDLFLDRAGGKDNDPPEVPRSAVDDLASAVEKTVQRLEADDRPGPSNRERTLLDAVDRVARLSATLGALPSEGAAAARVSGVLQRAMSFLEEQFRLLLESSAGGGDDVYPAETVDRLRRIAGAMVSSGFETDCCQAFSIARRGAVAAALVELGFAKIAAEELQKMPWEKLEGEISTWVAAFRRAIGTDLAMERRLCEAVFPGEPTVSAGLFSNLARGVIIQLLGFAEVVTGTQRAGEKLFKFLDMYETMRDLTPAIVALFRSSEEEDGSQPPSLLQEELKSELSVAKSRIGVAVVGIFSDLEISIRSDTGKTPVPGGAIHPLTRYVMNYLKYACEYKNTLEQIYQECHSGATTSSPDANASRTAGDDAPAQTPFAVQLIAIMDLLDANLDGKSKLYKDPSLGYIFLMNNGRYIAQKLKEWPEINEMLGAAWCRKRSSDLRQYHKNYQRDTWGKVLGCLKDEGLQQRGGSVSKTAVKERFKSFNSAFEEIHKTQSGWVVSDEQLQSELRVSVSAVVVPAYRSFLGRYRQYLEGGKQSDRYIKYAPEDLETCIEDLFDAKKKT